MRLDENEKPAVEVRLHLWCVVFGDCVFQLQIRSKRRSFQSLWKATSCFVLALRAARNYNKLSFLGTGSVVN